MIRIHIHNTGWLLLESWSEESIRKAVKEQFRDLGEGEREDIVAMLQNMKR